VHPDVLPTAAQLQKLICKSRHLLNCGHRQCSQLRGLHGFALDCIQASGLTHQALGSPSPFRTDQLTWKGASVRCDIWCLCSIVSLMSQFEGLLTPSCSSSICRLDYPNHTEVFLPWHNPFPNLMNSSALPWTSGFLVNMVGQVFITSSSDISMQLQPGTGSSPPINATQFKLVCLQVRTQHCASYLRQACLIACGDH
jgi:hypothetical protein